MSIRGWITLPLGLSEQTPKCLQASERVTQIVKNHRDRNRPRWFDDGWVLRIRRVSVGESGTSISDLGMVKIGGVLEIDAADLYETRILRSC
jgi:hypothetical protein